MPFDAPVEGLAIAMDAANIDTDQIIPARFLLKSRDAGYAGLLFHDQRFHADGSPRPGFPLDVPAAGQVRFLLANENFGCGSAREQAVYALADFGIRVVAAPSFGEIFRVNCIRNGVVPATVTVQDADTLRTAARDGGLHLRLLLRERRIEGEGIAIGFVLADDEIERLASGRDEIDETLALDARIAAYEAHRHDLPAPAR